MTRERLIPQTAAAVGVAFAACIPGVVAEFDDT